MMSDYRIKARGALQNEAGRFEPYKIARESDGWEIIEDETLLRTEIRIEKPRSIITRNDSPDLPFEQSLNPYRGCEHGCIYCYARPSHAYLGMSAGLDFETKIIARPTAPDVLKKALLKPSYCPKPLAIGTNTDPYQPAERRYRIMRGILNVLTDFQHPVSITTKGAIITRDIDLIGAMAEKNLAEVGVSITTLDAELCRKMEPRAPSPKQRLLAIEKLVAAGVPVRLMMSPVIPGLTDHEAEAILKAAREAGAGSASWIMLRLPQEVAGLWEAWLEQHYPERKAKIFNRLKEMHKGELYSSEFGHRMRGEGKYSEMLQQRISLAKKKLGYEPSLPALREDLFRRPVQKGEQLSLF